MPTSTQRFVITSLSAFTGLPLAAMASVVVTPSPCTFPDLGFKNIGTIHGEAYVRRGDNMDVVAVDSLGGFGTDHSETFFDTGIGSGGSSDSETAMGFHPYDISTSANGPAAFASTANVHNGDGFGEPNDVYGNPDNIRDTENGAHAELPFPSAEAAFGASGLQVSFIATTSGSHQFTIEFEGRVEACIRPGVMYEHNPDFNADQPIAPGNTPYLASPLSHDKPNAFAVVAGNFFNAQGESLIIEGSTDLGLELNNPVRLAEEEYGYFEEFTAAWQGGWADPNTVILDSITGDPVDHDPDLIYDGAPQAFDFVGEMTWDVELTAGELYYYGLIFYSGVGHTAGLRENFAIPEPTAATLLLGVTLLCGLRRRR